MDFFVLANWINSQQERKHHSTYTHYTNYKTRLIMHARRRSNKYQYHSLLFDFTKVQTMIYHTQEQHVNHNGYRHGQNKLKVYVIIDYLFKNVSTIFCQLVYIKTIFRKPTSHNMNLHWFNFLEWRTRSTQLYMSWHNLSIASKVDRCLQRKHLNNKSHVQLCIDWL